MPEILSFSLCLVCAKPVSCLVHGNRVKHMYGYYRVYLLEIFKGFLFIYFRCVCERIVN